MNAPVLVSLAMTAVVSSFGVGPLQTIFTNGQPIVDSSQSELVARGRYRSQNSPYQGGTGRREILSHGAPGSMTLQPVVG